MLHIEIIANNKYKCKEMKLSIFKLIIFAIVNLERWCRLRGNLLFYFKSKDPWSEPVGVIVLEQCQVKLEPPMAPTPLTTDGHYPFYLGNIPYTPVSKSF